MTVLAAIPGLDPRAYARSPLHADGRIWPEKNCYVDIWIELLNALQLEARAMLPFVLALDFEGDQWTFFKPVHGELYELYGLDVQELTVWKPLLEHALEHLPAGRMISTEADAWWLPDAAGTDYRRNHVKTTIVLNAIDVGAGTLDYFHNASYHRLSGEDFRALFRLDMPRDPAYLPLFAEFIRTERCRRRPAAALAVESRALVARHLARRPRQNPVARFADRFAAELPMLQARGLDHYHQWAFGTLRQLGAASELAAINLRWLEAQQVVAAEPAAVDFEFISNTCKTLVLKGARAVNARRALDVETPGAAMAEAWERAMATLDRCVGAGG